MISLHKKLSAVLDDEWRAAEAFRIRDLAGAVRKKEGYIRSLRPLTASANSYMAQGSSPDKDRSGNDSARAAVYNALAEHNQILMEKARRNIRRIRQIRDRLDHTARYTGLFPGRKK